MLKYTVPKNMDEAVDILSSDSGSPTIISGGTLTMSRVSANPHKFTTIVDLKDLNITSINIGAESVSVGAGVTLSELGASKDLAFLEPVVKSIGGPAIRNLGTIGGNIFYKGDLVAALLVLKAELKIYTSDGVSQMGLTEFCASDAKVKGVLSSISIDRPVGLKFGYSKLARRKLNTTSLVTAAVCQDKSGGSLIGLSGISYVPVAIKTDIDIFANDFSGDALGEILSNALGGVEFKTDYHATGSYRKRMVPLVIRRAIKAVQVV